MSSEYVTSETNLPENYEDGEIQLQVSDKDTKEIFSTRAKVSKDQQDLNDPEPLTIVQGPHENIEEQWYIEILESNTEPAGVDTAILRSVMNELEDDSNIITTRSEVVKTLLEYLTRADTFDSVSEASRSIMTEYFSENHPELVQEYVDLKVQAERNGLITELRDEE